MNLESAARHNRRTDMNLESAARRGGRISTTNGQQRNSASGRPGVLCPLWMVLLLLVLTLAACGKPQGGIFQPGSFAWSGGTGKIEMTCPQVRVEDGQAYATIVIDSPNYAWLKVDNVQYDAKHEDDSSSTFEIPVILDEKMEISGLTTAMSEPHEISYTICVGSKDASGDGGSVSGESKEGADEESLSGAKARERKTPEGPAEIAGLTFDYRMETAYAECFDVYYYADGYKLLDIHSDMRYLLIPEGADVPEGVEMAASGDPSGGGDASVFGTLASGEQIVILRQPLQTVYMAATAVMALMDSIDAMDAVRLSGTDADGWYLDAPKEALASGAMLYAGKYSEPDYELLVQEGCDLAIESTMILHTPEVQAKLEELEIPVLTDYSSYERHPLGRAEWVRFYGALFGKETLADQQFEAQEQVVRELEGFENTGRTVAFFYISEDGTAVVRGAEDYVSQMIEIAGGQYIFRDLDAAAGNTASVNLSMEEFYAAAADADCLIYNATIDAPLNDLRDLTAKSELFGAFRAVETGNVWTTDKNMYQATDSIGTFIQDLHAMLTGGSESDMAFLKKVK